MVFLTQLQEFREAENPEAKDRSQEQKRTATAGQKPHSRKTTAKKGRPHCGRQNGPAKVRGTKKRPPKWSRKYVLRHNVEPKSGRQNGTAFGRGTKKRPLFFQIFHLCSISGGPGFDSREPKRGSANTQENNNGVLDHTGRRHSAQGLHQSTLSSIWAINPLNPFDA